jgi:hypothetical protein
MDSHFESIIEEKIRNVIEERLHERALAGLNEDIQNKVKLAILMWQIEHALGHIKLKDIIQAPSWMEDLDRKQFQQVTDYIRSTPLEDTHGNILNWYKTRHRFRIERNLYPVASR